MSLSAIAVWVAEGASATEAAPPSKWLFGAFTLAGLLLLLLVVTRFNVER